MQKKHKKIILFSFILIGFIILAAISSRYLPFNKIFKISGTPEAAFVNRQPVNAELPHTLYFNFEVDPKSGKNGALYKGIAHSGKYSIKAFGKNSYSLSVERRAGDIGLENLGAVAMSAWVYVFPGKNDPVANFVFAASNESINIAWKGINVAGNDVPRGKWFKISGLFDLSDVKFKPDTKLVIYFWNNSNTDILIDDFYIVFGGQKPRRGDSTLTDFTRGSPFVHKFNFPPYPVHIFGKEEIGDRNSSFLVNNGKLQEGDISPFDRIFPGHFVSDVRGTDDILVINKTGNAELYIFCRDDKEFRKVTAVIPTELQPWFKKAGIITGCFSGNGSAQLLLYGSNGLLVGEFQKIKSPCPGDNRTSFKILAKTSVNPFLSGNASLIAADLEGNKYSDILATAADGSWKIYRFEKGGKEPFTVMASGNADLMNRWDSRKYDVKITPGRFLRKYAEDLLLTVSREKTKPGCSWSLLRFDPVSRTFIPCYGEKQNNLGKTIGLDTLKPSDEFFTGAFDNTGKGKVFRYNRDWRYDLKEILFNDTAYQVLANVDFSGYENDYNPKYYEVLRLVPAMLVTPGITSLLVIGKNCKHKDTKEKKDKEFIDLPALPGRIGVYSFKNTEK
jgi:hypothetical protein